MWMLFNALVNAFDEIASATPFRLYQFVNLVVRYARDLQLFL